MLETKEQKQIFAGCLVLVIILGVISFWHRPNLQYQDTTNYPALQAQSNQRQLAYSQYLASLGTTAAAQQELYKEILPAAEVQKAVEQELNTAQQIDQPGQPQTQMHIVAAAGKVSVANYFNSTVSVIDKINAVSKASQNDLYSLTGSASQIDSLIADLSSSLNQFSKLAVPKEVADFQSQELIALEAYLDMAKISKAYLASPSQSPWPQIYKELVIMSRAAGQAGTAFEQLNQKYNLLGVGDSQDQNLAKGNFFIPAAKAQILTTDIWAKAEEALRISAATAVAQFMLHFLNQLATKIQQAYRITNFLYYTDALVAGQYVDDYLNKYVDNPFDRNIIKNFIPAVSCGNNQNLAPVFQAKASQYLGFDPSSIDPSDPNYYQKLAKVGDFLSSPSGWQIYYQDAAAQANAAAQQAANNELNSSGNKSSRDVTGGILVTAQTTVDTMRAAIQNMLASSFAGEAGDPFTAKIVSQITQTFLNTFVFQGTVLKEQKACIAVPVVNLVTSLPLSAAP